MKNDIKAVVFELINVIFPYFYGNFYAGLYRASRDNFCFDCLSRQSKREWDDFNSGKIEIGEFYRSLKEKFSLHMSENEFKRLLVSPVREHSKILEVIESIRPDNEVRLFLYSNINPVLWEYIKNDLRVLPPYLLWYDRRFLSCEIGFLKHQKEMQKKAMREVDEAPERILYVDSDRSLVSGFNDVGGNSIYFDASTTSAETLKRRLAEYGVLEEEKRGFLYAVK